VQKTVMAIWKSRLQRRRQKCRYRLFYRFSPKSSKHRNYPLCMRSLCMSNPLSRKLQLKRCLIQPLFQPRQYRRRPSQFQYKLSQLLSSRLLMTRLTLSRHWKPPQMEHRRRSRQWSKKHQQTLWRTSQPLTCLTPYLTILINVTTNPPHQSV
jgi:hypothetical protein